jgi:type IV pilus assembly protein PilO
MATPEFVEQFNALPKAARLAIGIVPIVGIVAAVYFLVMSPVLGRIQTLEIDLKKVREEIQQNRMLLAQLEVVKKQAVQLEQQLAVLAEKLPTEREMPPLYRTLSDSAFQAGLAVTLFQPREAKVRDYYSEIPITLTAEGGYHDLATFFDRLAGLSRVVNVDQWKLSGLNRTKQPMRADITLATYTYRPVGAPLAPKTGVKK